MLAIKCVNTTFLSSIQPRTMAPLVDLVVASLTLILVKTLVELLSERFRSPLENLPGPRSLSWLRGAYNHDW
jgi:hypothetical protein